MSKSLTFDEPVFITSGYSYLEKDEIVLNRESPPLLQQLIGLPLFLFSKPNLPQPQDEIWSAVKKNPQKYQYMYASHFFWTNKANVEFITKLARLPIQILGLILISFIFFLSRLVLQNDWLALAPTTLAAFSPNLLAHSKYATSDFACTTLCVVSAFFFLKALKENNIGSWLALGVATSMALLSKFTAILLGPYFLCIGALAILTKNSSLKKLTVGAIIVTGVFIAISSLSYGELFGPLRYLDGLQAVYHNQNFSYYNYLLGMFSHETRWYYYFVALLLKSGLAFLILLGIAGYSLFRIESRTQFYKIAPVALFPLLLLLAACFDRSNLGVRRILPGIPFLFIFVTMTFSFIVKKSKLLFVLPFLAIQIVESLNIYPHHLSFFNTAVGGPSKGIDYLDDSNIDWAQDFITLREWLDDHPEIPSIKVACQYIIDPSIYSDKLVLVDSSEVFQPKAGYYAVSAHYLVYILKQRYMGKKNGQPFPPDWRQFKHIAILGNNIRIIQFKE